MDSLQNIGGTALLFWAFALVGTLFFAFRMVAMIVGGFGADVDGSGADALPHDGDAAAHAHHSDALQASESAFKLVSVNSLTGFFMMFGWSGLAAHKQFGLGATASFLVAFTVGLAAMAITALLFKFMMKLNSGGDRFSVSKAVGVNGSVYMQIPAGGRGRVQIVVNNVTRQIDAVAEDGKAIDSFVDVTVVRAVDPRTVSVRPAR